MSDAPDGYRVTAVTGVCSRGRRKLARSPAQIAAKLERSRERLAQERASKRAADQNPAQWHLNEDALRAQPDVEIGSTKVDGHPRAHRKDVFSRMLLGSQLSIAAFDAIRQFEADVLDRRGGKGGDIRERVSGSSPREVLTQRMLDAGDRVERVLGILSPREAAFLRELLEPHQVSADTGSERWRQVVHVMLGERQGNAQGAALRGVLENLAWAYRQAGMRKVA